MRRWILLLAALLVALLLVLAPPRALAQGSPVRTITAGQVIHGDIASVGESLLILGRVEGDVTSWSGSITILGEVDGDVVSYAGSIELGPAARVQGNVLSLGGGVSHPAQAQIAGRILGEQPLVGGTLMANAAAIFHPQSGHTPTALALPLVSVALALLGLFLSVACVALWPRRTLGISLALRRAPGSSCLIGLLTTVLFALSLFPVGALLALSLLGLPLLLPLTLLLQVPYLVGLAGIGRALGERIHPSPSELATAIGAALILLPIGVIGAIAPLWALAIFYLLTSVGLGAAILSRGGAYSLRVRA
ncbi:MAG: polymer-forming cytoskeletal protein [Oscillochloris sp.]|nr:polymer-forming cytoskeletal protein [Oscillochloris sp.]